MLPSRHTIADVRRQHSLRVTVGDVKVSDILQNIEVLFKDVEPGEFDRVGHTLSQDEIAGSEGIKADEIHVGKEFSVAAFSRHAPTDYGAKPVLIMPTCKKGSWQSSAQLLQKLIQAWKLSPFGEAKHGPLWSIASDGDATRRAALYLICMHKDLGPDDPLYVFLSELDGLNLRTGEGSITMDFDYKHLFKRTSVLRRLFASLLITTSGLCTLLCSKEGLLVDEELSEMDWSDESIHALLNPKDSQDVPRAVKLLLLVADLRHLDPSEFSPSERSTHRALCLLGEMFEALVEPFINPTLSLSEQVTHLVKFAHIACALFTKHEGDFVSNQLYGDLQCMVKNAIFKIAHSKVLNPMLKVFLCLLGDDVLETLFGRSRMIGGHSPNMAVDELEQRICSALRVDKIFGKYPYLERRARRLQMARSRDVDHLSPGQWTGDLTAQSCDIQACWQAGVASAKAVLSKYGCDIDFVELFKKEGYDLMRPKGGKYPGLSKDLDRSLADALDSRGSGDPMDPANLVAFDAKAALANETARADAEMTQRSISMMPSATTGSSAFDITVSEETTGIEQVPIAFMINLLAMITYSDFKCTGIKIINTNPITNLDAAPIAEISLPDTRYEIVGQILSLVPFVDSKTPSQDIAWAWATQFVAFESPKARQSSSPDAPTRKRHLRIAVDGRLVLPLVASDLKQATLEVILNIPHSGNTDSEKTWVFSNADLESMSSTLLQRVQNEEVHSRIPIYGLVKDGRYPYEALMTDASNNSTTAISHCLNSVKAPVANGSRRACQICGKSVAGPDRQNHMGKHIFLAQRGVEEEDLITETAINYPCGFCGQAMSGTNCTVGIAAGKKVISSCPDSYSFQITAAAKCTAGKPCTNVPIRCVLCQEAHWKYNMGCHLREQHPSWEATMSKESRESLLSNISITRDEEFRLGGSGMADIADQTPRGPETGQKRLPNSPAGTPRRSRVIKTSRTSVVTVARQQGAENTSSLPLSSSNLLNAPDDTLQDDGPPNHYGQAPIFWRSAFVQTLHIGGESALFSGSNDDAVHAIPEISRVGRYLSAADGSRFFLKGIAYQTQGDCCVFVSPFLSSSPVLCMEKGWGRRKRRLVQSLGTACTADCEYDEVAGPWRVCAARRARGGGGRSVPGTPRAQSVYPEDRSRCVYRRRAEGRVRRGQSAVTAPQAGCEAERRRRMTDMDFVRGVPETDTHFAGEEGGCPSREVDAPEAPDTVAARGAGNKHAKLGDAIAYLDHSLAPAVVSPCGVRALAKKLSVCRSCVGVRTDGCTLPGGCFGAWARDEAVVQAVSEFRSENCAACGRELRPDVSHTTEKKFDLARRCVERVTRAEGPHLAYGEEPAWEWERHGPALLWDESTTLDAQAGYAAARGYQEHLRELLYRQTPGAGEHHRWSRVEGLRAALISHTTNVFLYQYEGSAYAAWAAPWLLNLADKTGAHRTCGQSSKTDQGPSKAASIDPLAEAPYIIWNDDNKEMKPCRTLPNTPDPFVGRVDAWQVPAPYSIGQLAAHTYKQEFNRPLISFNYDTDEVCGIMLLRTVNSAEAYNLEDTVDLMGADRPGATPREPLLLKVFYDDWPAVFGFPGWDPPVERSVTSHRDPVFIYYKLYDDDEKQIILCRTANAEDLCLGRVDTCQIPAPHTLSALVKRICEQENRTYGFDWDHDDAGGTMLFKAVNSAEAYNLKDNVDLLGVERPGSRPQEPVLLKVWHEDLQAVLGYPGSDKPAERTVTSHLDV
ncbi:hypothetical protein K438DRAFT_1936875 [Mycena galopus ATCC 62051]|nr:hypothetical protein K438DRAFT_1936875 [Mycena galopus ATCC 62051]